MYAAPAAVQEHAVDHDIEIALPLIHLIVPEQNLRKARTMRLNARITTIALHCGAAAEDQAASAMLEHGRADVGLPRIHGDGRTRNPCLEERFRHAERGPRLLWAWLEHEPNLQRDDRQPERVHARRIRW